LKEKKKGIKKIPFFLHNINKKFPTVIFSGNLPEVMRRTNCALIEFPSSGRIVRSL